MPKYLKRIQTNINEFQMASAFIYSFTKIAKYLQKFKLEVVEYYLLGHANSVRSQIFNVHRLNM